MTLSSLSLLSAASLSACLIARIHATTLAAAFAPIGVLIVFIHRSFGAITKVGLLFFSLTVKIIACVPSVTSACWLSMFGGPLILHISSSACLKKRTAVVIASLLGVIW